MSIGIGSFGSKDPLCKSVSGITFQALINRKLFICILPSFKRGHALLILTTLSLSLSMFLPSFSLSTQVAPYFAKVECFCFESQRLLAKEQVDLPVFFFIDSDILDDPACKDVQDVVLSYTFFAARRNEKSGQLE